MTKVFFAALAAFVLYVVVGSFVFNLHGGGNWCAHPERPGNWIVQPIC